MCHLCCWWLLSTSIGYPDSLPTRLLLHHRRDDSLTVSYRDLRQYHWTCSFHLLHQVRLLLHYLNLHCILTHNNICRIFSCPGGYYCNSYGLTAPQGQCSAGFYCIQSSNSSTPTNSNYGGVCTAGSYCPAGSTLPTVRACP